MRPATAEDLTGFQIRPKARLAQAWQQPPTTAAARELTETLDAEASRIELIIVTVLPECPTAYSYIAWFNLLPKELADTAVPPCMWALSRFCEEFGRGAIPDFIRSMTRDGHPAHLCRMAYVKSEPASAT